MRALGLFWAAVVLVLLAGGATLQVLGPPAPEVAADAGSALVQPPASPPVPAQPAATQAPPPAATTPPATSLPPVHGPGGAPPVTARIVPGPRAPGAPVPPPDPALQEASGLGDGSFLPRVAGGLAPMRAYAAGAPPPDARPRVAILLADFAMREADSEEAIRILPAAVSFAVSPYALRPGAAVQRAQVERARQAGHETLIALPMEPRGYPLNDPGDRALLTGAPAERNAEMLRWTLSRLGGKVGVTGALGSLRGERFAASEQMTGVLEEIGRRGLIYVDPRPEGRLAAPLTAGPRRAVDLVVDKPGVRTEIEAKLERLEQLARDRGAALGLVSAPTPVAVERLAAWTSLLAQRGVVLVPVSALVVPVE